MGCFVVQPSSMVSYFFGLASYVKMLFGRVCILLCYNIYFFIRVGVFLNIFSNSFFIVNKKIKKKYVQINYKNSYKSNCFIHLKIICFSFLF